MIRQQIMHDGVTNIGDCFKVCIVNLTDKEYDDVPHFARDYGDNWWEETQKWGLENGFRITAWKPEGLELVPGTLAIGTGKSPRGDYNHCVIIDYNQRLYFDPNPSEDGIGPLIDVIVIERMDTNDKEKES